MRSTNLKRIILNQTFVFVWVNHTHAQQHYMYICMYVHTYVHMQTNYLKQILPDHSKQNVILVAPFANTETFQ